MHQAYIEPHACVARFDADGQAEIWASSQGHFVIRALTAKLLGMPVGDIRVTPAEIGGGFGGKTIVYLEPVADPARQEVRAAGQDRDEPRRGVQGLRADLGLLDAGQDRRQEGRHDHRRRRRLQIPGRRLPRLAGHERAACAPLRPYNIPNQHTVGYDVVCNRPKSAAYRAPGSPISAFAVESVLDILAKKIGMDPLQLRLKNAARAGTPMIYGPKLGHGGYAETSRHWSTIRPTRRRSAPTRGAASPRAIGSTAAASRAPSVQVNEDGTVIIATGSPDIGGSRASMALMAAETLGIDYNQIRSIVADTSSVGYTHVTGGSRVTFATGMAVVDASKKVVDELRARAAMIWDVDVEGVVWEDGQAKPAEQQCRRFPADVVQGARRQEGVDRRPDHRRRLGQCRRHGARLLDPVLRCRGRSRDRQGDDPALCRGAGCRQARSTPPMSRGRSRAASRRASAGRSTRSTSTIGRAGSIMPASSTTACRSPPTCR